MKPNAEYGVLAFASVLAGSISIDVAMAKVSVLQSPSAALARGSTFAWAPLHAVAGANPWIDNDIVQARLRSAVEKALLARGYYKVAGTADADLIVSYHVSLQERQELSLQGHGWCGPRFGCAAGGYDLHQARYNQGKLILDLTERRTNTLVWRALSDKKVKSKDASQEKLDKELMAMTKSLPPA
jgi:hypothetical protein